MNPVLPFQGEAITEMYDIIKINESFFVCCLKDNPQLKGLTPQGGAGL